MNLGSTNTSTLTPFGPAGTPAAAPASQVTSPKGRVAGLSFGAQLKKAQGEPEAPVRAEDEVTSAPKLVADSESDSTADRLDPRLLKLKTGSTEAAPEETATDALTRRVVWNDFLRKMKDELNVSPEKILSSFSKLEDEDLAKPPLASVDKIVAGLGLNDQQTALAKQYFNDLIEKTLGRSLAEEITASAKPVGFEQMAAQSERRQAMAQSLDRMNEQFFRRAPEAGLPSALKSVVPNELGQASQAPVSGDEEAPTDAFANDLSEAMSPDDLAPNAKSAVDGKASAKDMNALVDQMQSESAPVDSAAIKKLVDGMTRAASAKKFAATSGTGNSSASAGTEINTNANFKASQFNLENVAQKAAPAAAEESFTEDGGQDADAETPARTAAFLTDANGGGGNATKAGGDFAANLNAPKKTDGPVTIPELMQNAKILIKEGGGEMKVTMSPEGLGQVAMRVSVEHGKVNVTMLTQTDEVKHLIERQLGDLKQALATTHLQTGEIKVATMQHTQQNFDSPSNRDQQPTPQNFSQFQERGQNRRQAYGEGNPFSAPGAARVGARQATAMRGYGSSGRQSRLNLVA